MRRKLLITIINMMFLSCMFEVGDVISCTNNSDCDDNNSCTDDVCFHPGTGGPSYCIYGHNSSSCDDGFFCNGVDVCISGICALHSGNPCPPGTSCNEDTNSCEEPCFLKSIYGEDSEEVDFLRYYRDEVINETLVGQELIKFYYQWNPFIVKAMEEDEEFKEQLKEMIDGVLGLIGWE